MSADLCLTVDRLRFVSLLVEESLLSALAAAGGPVAGVHSSLSRLGLRDEAALTRTRTRLDLERCPPDAAMLRQWVGELATAAFTWHAGRPRLRRDPVAARLVRLVVPDLLVAGHPEFRIAADDGWDWPSIPEPDSHEGLTALRRASVDTHVHLGGVLPPLWYWVALMSGIMPMDSLRVQVSAARGHGAEGQWIGAIRRAAWLRLHLACKVNAADPKLFSLVRQLDGGILEALAGTELCSDRVLDSALYQLTPEMRTSESWDPLSPFGPDGHFAAGERALLFHGLAMLKWPGEEADAVARALFGYVKVLNSFHQLLVHMEGSDGLLRFREAFNRRRLQKPGSPLRRGRRRRRLRRITRALERRVISDALHLLLVEPYQDQGGLGADAPLRRVELRVNLPSGHELPHIARAWLDGVGDYLERRRLEDGATPPHQVGLVVHLKKSDLAAARAVGVGTRLVGALESYEWLRPFVVGFDAAGDERAAAPRAWIGDFCVVRDWAATARVDRGRAPPRLGFTGHVGEDPWDLMTGLRHVDEFCALALAGKAGRIGHGLVLAIPPRRYYDRRGFSEPSLGSHLLDLVWAWGQLQTTDANQAAGMRQRLERTWRHHHLPKVPDVESCWRTMGLSGDVRCATEGELLESLGVGTEIGGATYRVSSGVRWCEALTVLQRQLRTKLSLQGVVVEVNPTSNALVAGFDSFAELPYAVLIEDGLGVSINTDNPGLFLTSLPTEYGRAVEVLPEDTPSRNRIRWLEERALDADRANFLGDHVPVGERARRSVREEDK